jgi:DeoR/GlpR family transcriptional regulator of sugar metabolism
MAALGVERREQILRLLDDEGRVLASDLAPRLGVSLDTVRRDLDELGAAGVLRRVRGGALPPSRTSPKFSERAGEDVSAKRVIADVAVARLVKPGQLLALGGGTSVRELARRLPDDLSATVLTTAPDVAVALLDHAALEVILLGGPVNSETRTVTGVEAIQALAGVRPDVCFLGACSVHADAGVTVLHREEALVDRAMLKASARTAVLSASAKLGSAGPYVIGTASEIDYLVTDSLDSTAEIADAGVEVIAAS